MTEGKPYIPNTGAVKAGYGVHGNSRGIAMREAEFDRWLESVKAAVWDEGYAYAYNQDRAKDANMPIPEWLLDQGWNPYRPKPKGSLTDD